MKTLHQEPSVPSPSSSVVASFHLHHSALFSLEMWTEEWTVVELKDKKEEKIHLVRKLLVIIWYLL